MQFAITGSSAIENISVDDNTATITFSGGRSYDYTLNDVTAFVTALTDVMSKQESVGSFVNKQIKSETLQKITAWSSRDGTVLKLSHSDLDEIHVYITIVSSRQHNENNQS